MDIFDGNMPKQAYFMYADDQVRIPFRCRLEGDASQFYTRNIGGLIDIGTSALIVTKREFEYRKGAKVILDDILYSVISINPFIPDNIAHGMFRRKASTRYVIQLG
jgi:hypothetical protein